MYFLLYLDNDMMRKYVVYANIKARKQYAKDYEIDLDKVRVLKINML